MVTGCTAGWGRRSGSVHSWLLLSLASGACTGLVVSPGGPNDDGGPGSVLDGGGGPANDGGLPGVDMAPLVLGPVVITEIMYHPVAEDADVENHEFVEIHNRSAAPVALGKWTLGSSKGVRFTFPDTATLMPQQYAVVAKNKQMLAAVYTIDPAALYGDYEGELTNGKNTVTLADPGGTTVDYVAYSDAFPWPLSADAFGVADDWLPAAQLPITKHQYKGRSLERISTEGAPGSSTWPANWESSPIDGATPGKANASAGATLPIVEECSTCPNAPGAILRSGQPATLRARFSSFEAVSNVILDYFLDDLVKTAPAARSLPMTQDPDGSYVATLPDTLKDNDLIRYRIKAQRGGAAGVVAPRASDPLPWFTAFVSPQVFVKPGIETKERVYHLFVRPSDWGLLEKWIAPGRSTDVTACMPNPNWNNTVPATFIFEGKPYDVRVRYEGSRWNRDSGFIIPVAKWPFLRPNPSGTENLPDLMMNAPLRVLSWRIKFPHYDRFDGGIKNMVLNKMHQGCPGTLSQVEGQLLEKAGVPTYRYPYARLHVDGGYYGYMGQPEDIDETTITRAYPNEPVGDLFKNTGMYPGGHDGPVSRGDFWPLDAPAEMCPGYTEAQYYAATYERKTYDYRPNDDLIKLIKDLAGARKAGLAAVKKYFNTYWDVPALAATYAVRKWAGAWDDQHHNNFPYRRPNGKWVLIQQDFELDFGLGNIAVGHSRSSWDFNETLYQGWTDLSMQTCELPGVTTMADAQARGCTSCHGTPAAMPLAMPLVLPTKVTTRAEAEKVGCEWGGLPALADADAADAHYCSSCHIRDDPKTGLKYPTIAYSGEQALKLGCRQGESSSLIDAFMGAFKDEVDKAYCKLTMDGTLTADGVIKLIDESAKQLSLDDWLSGPAIETFCADPMHPQRYSRWDCKVPMAHEQMRAWARGRYKTVMQRLKCQ